MGVGDSGIAGVSHVPVLPEAALEFLRVRPDGVYVDCTAGAGGHSARIAERLTDGRLIALDRDPRAVALARKRLAPFACVTVLHRNYEELAEVCEGLAVGRLDGVLIDAGLSSMQLDEPERGFSFQQDGPLDMRMDPGRGPTAAELLARTSELELASILREYGDVGPARRIAAAIVARARQGRMKTTGDLREAVAEALPFAGGSPQETRTVFQAVRIAVNGEYASLESCLRQAIDLLKPAGRLVVIAFHSGEDRIVKQVFRDASRPKRVFEPDGRLKESVPPRLRVLTPKPVRPDAKECAANPRAQSARLRAAERLSHPDDDGE